MKEYNFQYTKYKETLLIITISMLACLILVFIGVYLNIQELLILILAPSISILLFQRLKKLAVHDCTAKLNEILVEFQFGDESRIVNFIELTSFKVYFGKNSPVLYLKSKDNNFKIYANSNFCKTENFEIFCKDIIVQLDKFKIKNGNINLIHEGSFFATKKALIINLLLSLLYLVSFYFETASLRVGIGIGGGIYLFTIWTIYLTRRKDKSH